MINFDPSAFDSFAVTVTVLLLVVIPVLGIKEFDLLVKLVRGEGRHVRVRFYRWVMSYEWFLTLALLAWWFALGRGAGSLGLLPEADQWQWLVVVGGLSASFLLTQQMNQVLENREQLNGVREDLDGMGKLELMAPRDNEEQRVFLFLSLTAGVCEEILYRGFLMYVFTGAVGRWPALILVAVVFGLAHGFQGRNGMLKAAAAGLVLGLVAVFSGSLLTGMVLHAVLDLTSGRIIQAATNLPYGRG